VSRPSGAREWYDFGCDLFPLVLPALFLIGLLLIGLESLGLI
jgi:hypothetical protein